LLAAIAVIVTSPSFLAVTTPLAFTVATSSLEDLNVIDRSVAFAG